MKVDSIDIEIKCFGAERMVSFHITISKVEAQLPGLCPI